MRRRYVLRLRLRRVLGLRAVLLGRRRDKLRLGIRDLILLLLLLLRVARWTIGLRRTIGLGMLPTLKDSTKQETARGQDFAC